MKLPGCRREFSRQEAKVDRQKTEKTKAEHEMAERE
jgi:hypothetical protein